MKDEKLQAVTDEKIVAALIANKSKKEAAKAAGISEQTLYNRLKAPECRALFAQEMADILRETTLTVKSKLSDAINTIDEIINNKEVNPAVRLQAAQTMINTIIKLDSQLIDADEYAAATQNNANLNNRII